MLCQFVIVVNKLSQCGYRALYDYFPLGSLKGFVIETFNSKEEGGGFFQVTHLVLLLLLNFPSCCYFP